MGVFCCFGSADDEEGPRPAVEASKSMPTTALQTPRTWYNDDLWAAESVNSNNKSDLDKPMQQRVREYIDSLYPQCAAAGSIEDMGAQRYRLEDGTCSPHTSRIIAVLDDHFTGIMYAACLILDLPADADLTPSQWLDSPEMESAKFHMLQMLNILVAQKINVKHAVARVFVGNDAAWCKFSTDTVEPSLALLNSEASREFREANDSMAKMLRKDPNVPVGQFRRSIFDKALRSLYNMFPGCTVWDEDALAFNVGGKPFAEPTRVLVARKFEEESDTDIKATVYRVNMVGEKKGESVPVKLLKNRNTENPPRGVVAVLVFVATPLSEVWPKYGAYAKSAAMKAAQAAAVEMVKTWNRQGKVEHCLLTVCMGSDKINMKFVGEHFDSPKVMVTDTGKEKGSATTASAEDGQFLQPFFMEVREDDKHELFESEVQFQAIKQMIQQRASENPDRYRAMAPQLALMSASHFLEVNYPGCEISDEGEIPVQVGGETITLVDTRFVVAKDPTKEKHNVIAALHLVPLPGSANMSWAEIHEKNWLGTKEMEVAEQTLLTTLKQMYKRDMLADDCMAQVMMATDATIYQFVDGERFEDYPEERQFKWQ